MILGFGGYIVYFKCKAVDVTAFCFIRKIKICAAVFEQLVTKSGSVIFVCIGPKMYPDEAKRIRGIVMILKLKFAIKGVCGIVERYADVEICFLLPLICMLAKRQLTRNIL